MRGEAASLALCSFVQFLLAGRVVDTSEITDHKLCMGTKAQNFVNYYRRLI